MMMEAVLYISIRWHEPDLSSADLAYNMALATGQIDCRSKDPVASGDGV